MDFSRRPAPKQRPSLTEGMGAPGLRERAPAESSRDAAEKVFADLRGERLIPSTQGAVKAADISSRRSSHLLAKPQGPAQTAAPRTVPSASAQPAARLWSRPAAKWLAGAAAVAGLALAAPWLAAHVGLVAAAGSVTLSLLGIPQIIHNFKAGREGTKDVVLAGPLMWFAAASLLSLVSIGQGSNFWWNAANLAGVAESLAVIGQLNYFKRDAKALKTTLLTLAAVAAPVALIATQALMPLSTGLTLAFSAAMAILWVLDAPQIRQNYHIFKEEGRAPQWISTLFKVLLISGSLMHLFAALMGGDLRWALNAAIAVVMGSTVLAQMYLPRAANSALGPVVRAAEKAGTLLRKKAAPADALGEARSIVDREFQGSDYQRFQSTDGAIL